MPQLTRLPRTSNSFQIATQREERRVSVWEREGKNAVELNNPRLNIIYNGHSKSVMYAYAKQSKSNQNQCRQCRQTYFFFSFSLVSRPTTGFEIMNVTQRGEIGLVATRLVSFVLFIFPWKIIHIKHICVVVSIWNGERTDAQTHHPRAGVRYDERTWDTWFGYSLRTEARNALGWYNNEQVHANNSFSVFHSVCWLSPLLVALALGCSRGRRYGLFWIRYYAFMLSVSSMLLLLPAFFSTTPPPSLLSPRSTSPPWSWPSKWSSLEPTMHVCYSPSLPAGDMFSRRAKKWVSSSIESPTDYHFEFVRQPLRLDLLFHICFRSSPTCNLHKPQIKTRHIPGPGSYEKTEQIE